MGSKVFEFGVRVSNIGPNVMYIKCVYYMTWTPPTFVNIQKNVLGLNLLLMICLCTVRSLKFRMMAFGVQMEDKKGLLSSFF